MRSIIPRKRARRNNNPMIVKIPLLLYKEMRTDL